MRPRRALARGGLPAARGKRSVFPERWLCKEVRTGVSAQAEYADFSEISTSLKTSEEAVFASEDKEPDSSLEENDSFIFKETEATSMESEVCCRRKFKHPTLLKRKKVVTVSAV
ncbi:hypothetical protein [Sediminibacillus albus]|uniref:hypothetical protein n=1 Tax=Sediminibacillus albus TaxID=407036 RepID=UPI000B808A23|nr:hypothetical protein [Sediminibacillus albus]